MLDPDFLADPFHGKGVLVNATPDKRVWNWFDEENRRWVSCTVYRVDPILDQNAEDQVDNLNRKWGGGIMGVKSQAKTAKKMKIINAELKAREKL